MAAVIENDSKVTVEFDLFIEDQLVTSTKEDGAVEFVMGEDGMVPGLEAELLGKSAGDKFDIVISPDDGYGELNEEAFELVEKEAFADEDITIGDDFYFEDEEGNMIVVIINDIRDDGVVIDYNHPLAGETLHFKGSVVKIA